MSSITYTDGTIKVVLETSTYKVVLDKIIYNEGGGGVAYTDEDAQDAVGEILTDTSTINLTYNNLTNQITADVIQSAINTNAIANDAGFIASSSVTYETLNTNGDVGTSAGQLAIGNHLHTGVYEPANANIQTHISSTSNPHSVTKTQVGLSNVSNIDTTTTLNITDGLNKRFVTDSDLTKLSNLSGTNSGDQDLSSYSQLSFKTISVSGQDDIVADAKDDTLTLVAGSNITLATNNTTDSITISAGASYSDEQAQDAIGTILVDSSTIDFTYNDDTPSITASVIQSAINTGSLNNNAGFITTSSVTYETLNTNGDVGTGTGQLAIGDHLHTNVYEPANSNIQSHISSTSNPHSVTKTQVGLNNVDNTSDTNKPVSTATQTALNLKADKSSLSTSVTASFTGAIDGVNTTYVLDNTYTGVTVFVNGLFYGSSFYTLAGTSLIFNNPIESGCTLTVYGGLLATDYANSIQTALDSILAGSTFSGVDLTPYALNSSLTNKLDVNGNGSALTGLTKTQVGLANVVNLDTSTTTNITDSTNKRFVTDSQQTAITHSNRTLLDSLVSNGDGSSYLANDGTYKAVSGGVSYREIVGRNLQYSTVASSTTYYVGYPYVYVSTLSTSEYSGRIYITRTGTIKTAYIQLGQSTAGSAETSSISIRVNSTTDYLVSSSINNTASGAIPGVFSNTSLNIPVTAGQYIMLKWVTPAWVTVPTSVLLNFTLGVES